MTKLASRELATDTLSRSKSKARAKQEQSKSFGEDRQEILAGERSMKMPTGDVCEVSRVERGRGAQRQEAGVYMLLTGDVPMCGCQ